MGADRTISGCVFVFVMQFMEGIAYTVQNVGQADLANYNGGASNMASGIHVIYRSATQNEPNDEDDSTTLDTWSVVWYIASFGGLILFFLIVSCSEWCCRRTARRNFTRNSNSHTAPQIVPETPPPSYDHFAPPDYDSICFGRTSRGEKSEYDIYVVPVHTFGTIMEEARREDSPPSYNSANAATTSVR